MQNNNLDREVFEIIAKEEKRQRSTISLIASENIVSPQVRAGEGSVLVNKYAEGYPKKRYYQGQENTDEIELLAIERAKKLFGTEYVNVQPHSGSSANLAIYSALLNPGDKLMGMKLNEGGHLTHGHKVSMTSKFWESVSYGIGEGMKINYDEMYKIANEEKPKIIVTGGTSYPWVIDFRKVKEIADSVGAFYLADVSHEAGLIAGGVYPNPINIADVVMCTTHKTLRGPRHAIIMSNKQEIMQKIDKAIFPGLQGGPMMHTISALAVALFEADSDEFKQYTKDIIKNSKAMCDTFKRLGYDVIGTETHLFLVRIGNGKEIAEKLEENGIICNANVMPNDISALNPSGIRIGTSAITTMGFDENDAKKIVDIIDKIIKGDNKNYKEEIEKMILDKGWY